MQSVRKLVLRWFPLGGAAAVMAILVTCLPLGAAVLPEDRADALYHSYKGGGIEINGPSILVLKQIGQSFAVSANYYIDSITSASIDVVTTASPYNEERKEYTVGVDYLRGKTTMSAAYTNSNENDFEANSAHFSTAISMFGDLTTVSLGYSRGWDTVGKRGDPSFSQDVDRNHYRVGLSQILTKNLILDLNLEVISDEGFLNNPYRSVRYVDSSSAVGYSFEPEQYPRTRTSNAVSARTRYFLPYRASLLGEYRFFDDSWGIRAHTAKIGYTHPMGNRWIFDFEYRYYTQSAADFYSDLFPFSQAQNFLARDKELGNFSSYSIGSAVSFEFAQNGWGFIDRGSLNLSYHYLFFDYENFRDLTRASTTPGTEPLYSFSADVFQGYISIWY